MQDMSVTYREIFDVMSRNITEVCGLKFKIDNLDLCSGVPLTSLGNDVAECAVLYFNDQRTSKEGIGRYVQVPKPKRDAILTWAETDPSWFTGSIYCYVQYFSSKGTKIAVFANESNTAILQRDLLKSFCAIPDSDIFFESPPRRVTDKLQLHLKLKTVTYYKSATEKGGKQSGEVIFRSQNYGDVVP
jgi:hypothetical protein